MSSTTTARPARIADIEKQFKLGQERLKAGRRPNALRPDQHKDEMPFQDDGAGCLVCHK